MPSTRTNSAAGRRGREPNSPPPSASHTTPGSRNVITSPRNRATNIPRATTPSRRNNMTSSAQPPPRHVFQFGVKNNQTPPISNGGGAENASGISSTPRLVDSGNSQAAAAANRRHDFVSRQQHLAQWMYSAAGFEFWLLQLPVALIMGGLAGCVCVVVHLAMTQGLSWTMSLSDNPWHWLWATTAGGALSGLVLLVPPCFRRRRRQERRWWWWWGTTPSILEVVETQLLNDGEKSSSSSLGVAVSMIPVVLASWVALSAGAPIGPETLLIIFVSTMARILSSLLTCFEKLCCFARRREAAETQRRDPSTLLISSSLVQSAGIVGVLVLFLPTPLLAPVCLLELVLPRMMQGPTAEDRTTSQQDRSDLEEPLLPPQSTPAEPDSAPLENSSTKHYVHQLALQLVAACAAFAVISKLLPQVLLWEPPAATLADQDSNTSTARHLVADGNQSLGSLALISLCLGVVCGLVGTLVLLGVFGLQRLVGCFVDRGAANLLLCVTSPSTTTRPQRRRRWMILSWFLIVLISAIAGLLQGTFAVLLDPSTWQLDNKSSGAFLTKGGGLALVQAWSRDHGVLSSLEWPELLMATASRVFGLALTLGLGNMVGGLVTPMLAIGLLVGQIAMLAVEQTAAASMVPDSLIVVASMAGCVVSICPIPFTVTVAFLVLGGGGSGMMTAAADFGLTARSLFLIGTCLVAYMVTGGFGFLRRAAAADWGRPRGLDDDDEHPSHEEESPMNLIRPATDEEILEQMRSILFGSNTAPASSSATSSV